ncbi:hypothetical protein MPSEU_000866100 [Mayamaea pseudoterrestris]|nr:hypothetical protein MPSEU_000866100 [Mayamaea pseudoterrestris]
MMHPDAMSLQTATFDKEEDLDDVELASAKQQQQQQQQQQLTADDDASHETCSLSVPDESELLRIYRIKYRVFRDSKLKLCSDSPYDVIVCSESKDVWSTFVLSRVNHEADDIIAADTQIQAFEVTLSMSPLQRQVAKVGWIAKSSVATYDGSTSSHMAVIARDTDMVENAKTFYIIYNGIDRSVAPIANVDAVWEQRTINIRCVLHEKTWMVNGKLLYTDDHDWMQEANGSELLPLVKMNQGSFSFTRIELGD